MKWLACVLVLLCVLVAVLGLTDKSDVQVSDKVLEGEHLRLLSEISDEEFGRLALPEGAGETDEEEVQDVVSETQTTLEPEADIVASGVALDTGEVPSLSDLEEQTPNTYSAEPVCYNLGEFRSLDDLSDIERRLEAFEAETLRVTRLLEEPGPYMVYIPPMDSETEARNIVALLRSDGLDSIIIRDPPFINGVSLGVFRSDTNSADLVSRVRGLDYNVQRRQMMSTVELHSLVLSGPQVADIEENFWQEIRDDFDEIQVLQKSCDEVASASNFQ